MFSLLILLSLSGARLRWFEQESTCLLASLSLLRPLDTPAGVVECCCCCCCWRCFDLKSWEREIRSSINEKWPSWPGEQKRNTRFVACFRDLFSLILSCCCCLYWLTIIYSRWTRRRKAAVLDVQFARFQANNISISHNHNRPPLFAFSKPRGEMK